MHTNLLKTFIIASITILMGCNNQQSDFSASIIPQPVEINLRRGNFTFGPNTKLIYQDEGLDFMAQYASSLWEPILGFKAEISHNPETVPSNSIFFEIFENPKIEIGNEGYVLEIKKDRILLSAKTSAGILYGIQTIYQLLGSNQENRLPCLVLTDYPRFAWRGMHMDVSRHFMPIEFIYKMMDYMAMHKLNVFHWHLIDDQGWRLEIKKYPRLTEIGAWRVDMPHLHWNERPLVNDPENATYGGYYTQDEVRALVAYAAERNITVVPEIEMPAHVMSALAAYPEFSCTGENLGVPPGGVWPITHIYCAGKDETFHFLKEVLTEVMELFPSPYIHVGGDEADKANWKKCPKCQARIKNEGLAGEEALQSYFIQRIERFLNAHGRTLIGWDEILEGGLTPNAIVMSWRGEEGGIEAARMGHKVIMTPGSHCYFDHYQGDPAIEPLAFGGYTTLKKVYSYEPIPPALTAEQDRLVLGAQANVWTEYMPGPEHVEYMVFPRLAAMSEVLWSPKEQRDWASFSKRMKEQYRRYDLIGINYSLSAFQVKDKPVMDAENRQLLVELHSDVFEPDIRFTLNGSEPDENSKLYKEPIPIKESSTLKAAVFQDGKSMQQVLTRHYDIHQAFAAEVHLEYPNSPRYDGHGEYSLVNGIRGTKYFNDGNWKGFLGDDMIATIRLDQPIDISSIEVDALQNYASWIFFPTRAIFEVSDNGQEYRVLDEVFNKIPIDAKGELQQIFKSGNPAKNIQYIRIRLINPGICPPGHSGEGEKSWIFVSEIIVK